MPISASGANENRSRGEAEEIFHLRGRQVGGRAAAPVKLHHGRARETSSADVLDFALERCEIGRRDAVILGDDHVAGAKKAQALAEGQVHVERDRRARRIGLRVDVLRDRRGRNRRARPAPWDSWCSAGRDDYRAPESRGKCGIARGRVRDSVRNRGLSHRVLIPVAPAGAFRDLFGIRFGTGPEERLSGRADCPARIKAAAFSTGVSGQDCRARLRMWPRPLVCATAPAHRMRSPRAKKQRRIDVALKGDAAAEFCCSAARSMRQSTLSTFAPVCASKSTK